MSKVSVYMSTNAVPASTIGRPPVGDNVTVVDALNVYPDNVTEVALENNKQESH